MKLSCTQKFPMSTLVGASLSLWTYHHVSGLRARCDLHQLEFNHVTFLKVGHRSQATAARWTKAS